MQKSGKNDFYIIKVNVMIQVDPVRFQSKAKNASLQLQMIIF